MTGLWKEHQKHLYCATGWFRSSVQLVRLAFTFPAGEHSLVPFDNDKHTVLTHWSNTQVSICPVWCDWLDEFNFKLPLWSQHCYSQQQCWREAWPAPRWSVALPDLTSDGGKRLKDQMTEKANTNAHVGKHQAVADRWHLHGQNSSEQYLKWCKIRGTSARMKQPTKAQILHMADVT